jgi:hypothetical protein
MAVLEKWMMLVSKHAGLVLLLPQVWKPPCPLLPLRYLMIPSVYCIIPDTVCLPAALLLPQACKPPCPRMPQAKHCRGCSWTPSPDCTSAVLSCTLCRCSSSYLKRQSSRYASSSSGRGQRVCSGPWEVELSLPTRCRAVGYDASSNKLMCTSMYG